MNVALMAVVLVTLILAVILGAILGWVCFSRGKRIRDLRGEKARLQAKVDGFEILKTHLKIVAHGKSGEPVTILASRPAAQAYGSWGVIVTGPGVNNAGTFQEVAICFLNGTPTVVLRVDSRANSRADHVYPGVERFEIATR